VIKRFAKPARELIDADPADAVALDALLFSLNELEVGDIDPGLYQVALEHHVASEKIDPLIGARSAPVDFLRGVAAQSPHEKIRLWANYHLAENRYAAGKPSEAEPLLEALKSNATAKELGGYTLGTLADTAGRLLFEIRRLNVGQEVPEVTGPDLDGTPLKLSEFRGKVTLVVFWATWCGPCMAMVPHERALAERYAGKPFAIVGVNGDILRDPNFTVTGADGKVIDHTERVKAAVDKNKITWRSFRNGVLHTIASEWNVRSWPTVYLVDHRGIIRGKWKGDPGAKDLDAAVEKLVNVAEAEKDQADGRKPMR
jgi:thiol-disulfide isomerase/thioredoxin